MSVPQVCIRVHQEDERGNVFTLMRPIHWYDVDIPSGFESDGASVPRFFWRCVFPPGDSRALFAAFVHDYAYRVHPPGWSREDADDAFLILLREGGVPRVSARLAWIGVRLFGKRAWNAGGSGS